MKNLKDYLTGIAIGVKYRNNYAIEDHMGSIIDEILYRNNSPLNYVTFPLTSPQRNLHNPKTGDTFVLNRNNIILDINFTEKITKENSKKLIDEYFRILTQKIYKIVNIQDIYLIGIVHKYLITDEASARAIYNNFKNITFDDATSITVNFVKKNILPDTKIKKGYNDYENTICTLSMTHDKKSEYAFHVDYQHIFDPLLDSIIDIDYKNFVDKVISYNTNTINEWIVKHEKN
jgi:phosphopantetheinyl transferase (holo-ACP synthase)